MAYQKLKGDHLFDGKKLWEGEKVLVLDQEGNEIDIIPQEVAGDNVEYIPGLITPGFVNAHCHLELSHLKNAIQPYTRLVPFLLEVVSKRNFPEDEIEKAIENAIDEMENDGIIGVGDICNTAMTAPFKTSGKIQWRNFIEVLSFTDANAIENISKYQQVLDQFERLSPGSSSLSPHAPYSISEVSFNMINDATQNKTISIHNQETSAENELYQTGGGEFLKLYAQFGFHGTPFPVTGTTSIRHYLPHFTRAQKIILVHNSYMPEEDIAWANQYASQHDLTLIYCLCVNANLYIEDHLPPVEEFIKHGCEIVLGTDSYSSNWNLKITEEILTITKYFPAIQPEQILRWATINGAAALGLKKKWITGSDLIKRMEDRQ
jgi:cytosine/adenosine deaminase-related metal-dependent hydrolase